MFTKNLYQLGRKVSTVVVACALAIGAANVSGEVGPVAPGMHPARLLESNVLAQPVADLEKAFWVCDHIAATRGVEATPVELCSVIYDVLKTRKFGGDFEQLLDWWRQNKPAEHEKLSSGGR